MMKKHTKLGSAAYSRELAAGCEEGSKDDGFCLGITDSEICATALRFHASRWRRRSLLAVAFGLVAATGFGLPDLNGDGRVGFADLALTAHGVIVIATTLGTSARPLASKELKSWN